MTSFSNFGTPSIYRERFELVTSNFAPILTTFGTNTGRFKQETSNLAHRLITGGANYKNAKIGQWMCGRGNVTYYSNFGTPSLSQERFKLETSKLARRLITGRC